MSFEQFPDSVENDVSSYDSALERAAQHESRMQAREADVGRALDSVRPETAEDERLLDALKTRANDLSGPRTDLRMAAQTAALSVALHGIIDSKGSSPANESKIAEILSQNPDIAEMIMRGVLSAAQSLEAGQHVHTSHDSGSRLAEEAKNLLQEIEKSEKGLLKGLAFRTTERVIRAIVSASTLGIGGVVYDSVKDVYQSVRVRSQLRAKKGELLTSTALA